MCASRHPRCFVSSRKSFMSKGTNCTKDVMHKYSPEFKFSLFCQIFFLLPICINTLYSVSLNIHLKVVSEYDQEIPQSQTADNPVALRGRAAQPSRDTRITN